MPTAQHNDAVKFRVLIFPRIDVLLLDLPSRNFKLLSTGRCRLGHLNGGRNTTVRRMAYKYQGDDALSEACGHLPRTPFLGTWPIHVVPIGAALVENFVASNAGRAYSPRDSGPNRKSRLQTVSTSFKLCLRRVKNVAKPIL